MTHIIQYLSKSVKINHLVILLIAVISFLPSQQLAAADDDFFTDIILINGQAELADFNKDGDILMRHVVVPDYFTSGRSHKRSLRSSLKKLQVYGAIETPTPAFYHAPVQCRQSVMSVKDEVVITQKSWALGLDEDMESSIVAYGEVLASTNADLEYTLSESFQSKPVADRKTLIFAAPKQRLVGIERYWWVSEEQLLI